MTKLTPRQEAFVREYLVDLNGKQAAIRAGYSERSAESTASALLRVPKVAEAVAEAKGERARRCEVSADRVLQELARIAFADPAAAYGPDGKLLSVREMPPETRSALAGMDVEEGGDGKVTRKVKTWGKVQALELLGKHLGMFTEKVEHSAAEPVRISIDLGGKK
jgi:phage terminase small subunit